MDAIQKWNTEIKRLMAEGLQRHEAFACLAKADPALRREYVEAHNAMYNRVPGHV